MEEISQRTVAEILVRYLEGVGVDTAFGVSGAYIAPVWRALSESSIRTVHCRHETGATFCAAEYSLYLHKPAAVFTTAGPGIINALTAVRAAKLDGAKVIFIGPITTAQRNGLWGLQQTTVEDVNALQGDGNSGYFDQVVCIDEKEKISEAIDAINHFKVSQGHVLGIFILPHIQKSEVAHDEYNENTQYIPSPIVRKDEDALAAQQQKIAEVLAAGNTIIWNGYGCLSASDILTRLAIETQTAVMSTPRGKGIFPEKHPLYLGTTGLGCDETALLSAIHHPSLKSMVILGTRLGESSSHYLQNKIKGIKVYYVSLENADIKNNLPPETEVIDAELSTFLEGVYQKIKTLPHAHLSRVIPLPESFQRQVPLKTNDGLVNPKDVMAVIQKVAIDEYDCLVAADAGNSHVWTNRYLQFQKPNRYRVNSALGTMGHYASGIVGLAMSGKVTVGIIGDGSMLMNNEISTAVQHRAPAIWVVLNDGGYNMCRQGLNSVGYPALDCAIPQVDFALFAHALGADGIQVTRHDELETALRAAITQAVPTVIDVRIDRDVLPPVAGRNKAVKSL
ncbi:thiamine pyrophosphate-binding protein [Lonsdalea britannica]|uniref:thiamine pyrophosphate-binding protein n=1 Tax=Lonsdalea britannica TaxID=1082704 RepID=UPI0026F097ED|nr:thiamine pyrophosphate-binding protein [Lonsdalea britannica]